MHDLPIFIVHLELNDRSIHSKNRIISSYSFFHLVPFFGKFNARFGQFTTVVVVVVTVVDLITTSENAGKISIATI